MGESSFGAGIALFVGLVVSGSFLAVGMVESASFSFVLALLMATFFILLGDGTSNQEEAQAQLRSNSNRTSCEKEELATLRKRYVRGQLSEQEFERKLEPILASDSSHDARNEAKERSERSL